MASTDSTWEDVIVIKAQFPNFDLEDKVSLGAGGIVPTVN